MACCCCWWRWWWRAEGGTISEGRRVERRDYIRPPYQHRHRRPIIDDPESESSNPDEGDAPTLTLSIVRLDRDARDRRIEDVAFAVLDDLTCLSPSDALELMGKLRNRGECDDDERPQTAPVIRDEVIRSRTTMARGSIMRYRLERDRWTSFTSLLLKSLAYYRSVYHEFGASSREGVDGRDVDDGAGGGEGTMKYPIVDLPRTAYNRPYLPYRSSRPTTTTTTTTNGDSSRDDDREEDRRHSMNVSHQYPWVCMVQQRPPSRQSKTPEQSHYLLGMDVVVFEARTNDYAPTIAEFLEPFANSFTPWEWDRISNDRGRSYGGREDDGDVNPRHRAAFRRPRSSKRDERSRLREFYLRWSMKEAYTKALGLGMHVDFDRVEIRLLGTDLHVSDEDFVGVRDGEEGIWSSIEKNATLSDRWGRSGIGERRRYYSAIGKVKRIESNSSLISPWDVWEIIFVPLLSAGTPSPRLKTTAGDGSACACICRGPLPRISSSSHVDRCPISTELLTLLDLIRMHGSRLA